MKWFLFLVGVLALAIYGQLLGSGPISWDDDSNIFKNPYYAARIWSHFWQDDYFGLYVPVTSTIWQMLYTLGNGSALPFRILNPLLHLANGVLVYLLLSSLASRWKLHSSWAILAATALFLLHPQQGQAVSWISGGRDLISAFFALSAVYLFFRTNSALGVALSTICYTLAIFSKPNCAVLPALLPILTYIVDRKKLSRSLLAGGLWLIPTAYSAYMNIQAQADFLISLKWWERGLVAADTYTFYLQKFVWPWPLSVNYDRQPAYVLATWGPSWRLAMLLVLTIPFFRWAFKKDPRFLIALAWFALLLPVSGLVAFGYQKISTTADHYHYLPMVVLSAFMMLLLNMWSRFNKTARFAVPVLIFVLAAASHARVQVWKNDRNFFAAMVKYAPESYSTGLGMSVVSCAHDKNYNEGIRWTEVALKERPNDIMALANQAYCYLHAKDHRSLVAMELFLNKLDLKEMEQKQPTAYTSFLASVGTGLFEIGEAYDGFQFLCEAYRIHPSGENHKQNLEVGYSLLLRQGLQPKCESPFPGAKKRN